MDADHFHGWSQGRSRSALHLPTPNAIEPAEPAGTGSLGVPSEVIDLALFAFDEFSQKVAASSAVLP